MKKIYSLLIGSAMLSVSAYAQLNIGTAQFFIQAGGVVTVQGDLTSSTDIQGTGKIVLAGSANQNVNMNGFTIPNLEMNNTAGATLTGAAKIGTDITFTLGKISLTTFDLTINSGATITTPTSAKYFVASGTGQLKKGLTADITDYVMPVGDGTNYHPALLTVTGGAYASALIGVRSIGSADANRPPMMASYVNTYWPVTKNGITGGTTTLKGTYNDPEVVGTEANLAGYYFNGTDWSSTSETHNVATNIVSAPISGSTGELYAMNKFVGLGARAFLGGPFNTGTGVMDDLLRTPSNSIPTSDPYRTTPYNTYIAPNIYTHVNNATTENLIGTPLADQGTPANNIVDWVFLELRNNGASPGNTLLETRSALIQKDGDIVDVDGTSPVTFNNIVGGNYAVTVRHRNHLGLGLDPVTSTKPLSETKSIAYTGNLIDFSTLPDAQLFGTANAYQVKTVTTPSPYNVNVMWAGDANGDGKVKYAGTSTDPSTILNQVIAFPGNVTGLYNYNAAFGYFSGDVNMDRKVKYAGTGTDPSPILTNVLAFPLNVSGLYNFNLFNQQIPN